MCGWHPISVGQHWPKKNCMWIQTCRNIWEFLFSGRCFLHCSLWEHKSLAKMIVKRDISGSSSLSRLLLSIYHDHCGSHQWKSLCTLERSLTHYSWLCFWTYSNLHWLPLHLGHGCHPGIPLHCPLTAFFTFSFVRSLILLALLLMKHTLQDFPWERMCWVNMWRCYMPENTFILPWLGNRILGWK